MEAKEGPPSTRYSIDNKSFRVSLSAYNALVEGIRYRPYYLPRSKRVLSVEPLETLAPTQTEAFVAAVGAEHVQPNERDR